MNPLFQFIIADKVKKELKKKNVQYSDKEYKSALKKNRVELKHHLRDTLYVLAGILAASIGLKSFLLPNSFLDGGVMGISLIISKITEMRLSYLIVLVNIPFLILAFPSIGKQFAIKSIISIVLLAVAVYITPFSIVTEDRLLIAVFGGFFVGLGIGLAMRGGCVLDGTEILAVFISRKTSLSIGDIILIFNVIIFAVAAYVFSLEIALYAILTYLAASKTVDYIISGIEEYIGVTIISEKSDDIRTSIIENLGRGCTIYQGKKGFAKRGETLKSVDIVYTLLTRWELAKLETEVEKIDENAFIVMHSIKDAKGGMIKKRPLK
jgi:uncharacterized membrane-anchored protein YitT (DUF2179 family)